MNSRTVGIAKALDVLTEAEWSAQLFSRSSSHPGLATSCGWRHCYHTYRSIKSPTGFPDWCLVRDRVIFAELKTEHGQVSDVQREWLDGLAKAGAECYLWRPGDLDEIADILAHRWMLYDDTHKLGALGHVGDRPDTWTPASMWIPGVGRRDTTEQKSLLEKGAPK